MCYLKKILLFTVLFFLSACTQSTPSLEIPKPTPTLNPSPPPLETPRVKTEGTLVSNATATPHSKRVETDWPDITWPEIVAEASGQQINWHYWGGSSRTNQYVIEYIGNRLKNEYNITLNPVLLNDTAEAVTQVTTEADADIANTDSIDLIWINGENFKLLSQDNLLFGPYVDKLPNHQRYVNPDNPAAHFDFGFPVNGYESLWTASAFIMEYDSNVITDPPHTIPEFMTWICENPGQFTYIAPPSFLGTAFLTHLFYYYTGGSTQWQDETDAEMVALFNEKSPALWAVLNQIEPCLWQEGKSYPTGVTELEELLVSGEISIGMAYRPAHANSLILEGRYPNTIRTFVFEEGTVANASYVAIPFNAPHKAAALVVANLLLDPEAQLEKFKPVVWGDFSPLDQSLLPLDIFEAFEAVDLGESTLAPSKFDKTLPPLNAGLVPIFEDAWRIHVLEK